MFGLGRAVGYSWASPPHPSSQVVLCGPSGYGHAVAVPARRFHRHRTAQAPALSHLDEPDELSLGAAKDPALCR